MSCGGCHHQVCVFQVLIGSGVPDIVAGSECMCLHTTWADCVHTALSKAALVALLSGRVVETLSIHACICVHTHTFPLRKLIASAPFRRKRHPFSETFAEMSDRPSYT